MVDVGVGDGERTRRKRDEKGSGDNWEDGDGTTDAEESGVLAIRTSCQPCCVL